MEQLKAGLKEPLMMPGPKFKGKGDRWSNFFKNRSNAVFVIIAILIIAGGIYLYSNYKESNQAVSLEEKTSQENQEEGAVKPEQINTEGTQPNKAVANVSSEKAEAVESGEDKIVVKANKGAGVTHLAREALSAYLELHPELKQNITPEHKIYIEDYLKDKTGSYSLTEGQELTFNEDLIKEAIDSSQKLTEGQLKNLHKYVLLVPSLST